MVNSAFSRLNFGVFRNPLFLVSVFLYVLNTVLRQQGWSGNAFLNNYLNDLLCLPLVLGAAIFFQRNVVLRQPAYALSKWQIGVIVVYFSVMFEVIFPQFMPRYTADFLDVICYVLGGWLFWIFGNANGEKLVIKN